ncbi:integrase [Orientia tsutsugamushi str. Gilliam]|uniref:Integrase n=1 Tax=Orientia tsutsugamushi str. Gilliam TaxID=1359184 RepID=A0A2U3RH51_ORITS|nr:hypothetical protein [Orientia tsutsugamushi]SPR12545.1 integrase [Orientia tsutsugamushi str. Gilliam]
MPSISLKLTNSLLRKIKIPNEGTLIINDLDELSLKLRISWAVRKTWSVEKNLEKRG